MSKFVMKKSLGLLNVIVLIVFCSCPKQQTEAERNAEIDSRVQQQLAAEHQAQQQQELEKRQADLDAREKALAEKENTPAQPAPVQTAQPVESSQQYQPSEFESGPTSRPTASYSTFYTKLEPYGSWLETDDYGYVWQPHEAERSRNWRPYTDGHWAYTDLGWMWVSDEAFGWAAYHYGRWTRIGRIGWVWVPGEQWAPAWVSWRKSNDYVGWAPLPPEARFDRRSGIHNWADNYYDIGPDQYSFVPTREFGAQRVAPIVVPPERNVNIINETTNVTNITYNNTTVINQGPDYDDLRSRSQQQIARLRVERQTGANIEREQPRAIVKGEVIQVPAPVIASAQPADRPRRIKEKVARATVDRGWNTVADPKAAERARAKIRAEATPPPDAPWKKFVRPAQQTRTAPAPATKSSAPQLAVSPAGTTSPIPKQSPRIRPVQPPKPLATATPAATQVPQKLASPTLPRPRRPTSSPRTTFTPALVPSASPHPAATRAEVKTPATPVPTISVSPPKRQMPPVRGQTRPKVERSVSPSVTPTTTPPQPAGVERKAKDNKKDKKREKKPHGKRGEESPTATPTSPPQ